MFDKVLRKIRLENMLAADNVTFITEDKKNIHYSEERGMFKVEVGKTTLYFDGYIGAYNYLKNYRIKKAVQDNFTSLIA